MRRGRFRRIPVVDQNKTLVGLVTLDDILMLLAEEFMEVGKLLESETPAQWQREHDGLKERHNSTKQCYKELVYGNRIAS